MNFLIRNQFSMCSIIYCSLEQIIKNELVSHIAKKKRNEAELVILAKTEVGWQTATFPLSPGSAIRRFQWHAEDQLLGEWGLRDRGLESRPDQNEMNIQSEAKPHGLICPFTMAVIIWEFSRLLLRQDEKAFWQNRKVFSFLLQEKFWRKLAAPHKGIHESRWERG